MKQKKGKRVAVNIYMHEELKKKIREYKASNYINVSAVCRKALRKAISKKYPLA